MFTTQGIITYNPKRKVNSDWWLTIELPKFDQIGDYYRWHIDRAWVVADSSKTKRKYCRPSHNYHVSIIRGEKPRKNLDDWGKYLSNEIVDVHYDNNIRQTNLENDGKDNIWFIDANWEKYAEMRKYFGLDYQRDGKPFIGHITIVKVNEV